MATATTTARPAIAQVQIESLRTERMLVPIIGTKPLIMHRFDEKAKRQILEATQGKRKLKEPKDPEADFERSIYGTVDGRYGFPTLGFKAATVSAARFWGKTQISMTMLRQCVFFTGEMSDSGEMLTVIEGEPTMREDYVRVGQGTVPSC